MSAKVLFIHGLASCGSGNKATALANHFGRPNLVAPDLPMDPAAAIRTLENLLQRFDIDLLVGSSLGGFYAVWLNRLRPIPTVLVNPATAPWTSLSPFVGTHKNWCTGDPCELTRDHLEQLRDMARWPDPAREAYLVLLGEQDEVLEYRIAATFFSDFDLRIASGDDHRLRSFPAYLPYIDTFRHSARTKT